MSAAAFFDMDGTLLRGESQFSFLLWCLRNGLVPAFHALPAVVQYASYLLGISSDALRLRQSGVNLLRGISTDQFANVAKAFFQTRLTAGFRRQALPVIEAHRAKGHLIVVLTSASEPVANLVAGKLRADAVIATRLLVRDGVFTGERELPEPYGDGKRVLVERFCLAQQLSPQDCFAYTDHHTDVSLLEFIGHPIAANPTRKLRSIAEAKKWPIVDLDSTAMPTVAFPEIVHSC